MREIKFRAQILQEDKVELLTFDLGDIDNWFAEDDVFYVDGIPCKISSIQQYTGLKDKNGVDVYEGDVITNHGITNDMKQRVFEIVWMKGRARFAAYDKAARMKTSIDSWDMSKCEVIGTIHDTPAQSGGSDENIA